LAQVGEGDKFLIKLRLSLFDTVEVLEIYTYAMESF